ncbi:MAG: permease [Acidobacteriota bacterium]|nr:permease [Acidobacteriota bacterium]
MPVADAFPISSNFGPDLRTWLRCNARPITLTVLGLAIMFVFWFGSRYPALLLKAHHSSQPLASMAFSREVFRTTTHDPISVRILFGALNWLGSMAIGMTFGLLFGALMYTVLQYHPLRIGQNYTLNSLKGALVGVPMGVCANCAVPMACGLTRGHGRVEVALGYLFSSPNFNPVVIAITFTILPWYFGVVKYLVLLFLILFLVPRLIRFLEVRGALTRFKVESAAASCSLEIGEQACNKPFIDSAGQVLVSYAKHVWMLFRPTISLMVAASLLAAALLVLVPWSTLLGGMSGWRLMAASALGVFMPVPIALDVLFAGELYRTGISAGYTMMFLMTLGTYSVIPAVYLWREISRTLAISLFAFFLVAGVGLGFLFSALA